MNLKERNLTVAKVVVQVVVHELHGLFLYRDLPVAKVVVHELHGLFL